MGARTWTMTRLRTWSTASVVASSLSAVAAVRVRWLVVYGAVVHRRRDQ